MTATCTHAITTRGKDAPRRYGSFRTQVCTACGAFRLLDHGDKPWTGRWVDARAYAEATADLELD